VPAVTRRPVVCRLLWRPAPSASTTSVDTNHQHCCCCCW